MNKLSLISELFEFALKNKKWWLLPIILFLITFGALIVLAEGSVLAPFIYAIFWITVISKIKITNPIWVNI